jgi:hypothetical protein
MTPKSKKKEIYGNIHQWLRYHYGKPTKCENPEGCIYPRGNANKYKRLLAPKRFEYALLTGKKHAHNRENYIMLCPSCHGKYDKRGFTPKKKIFFDGDVEKFARAYDQWYKNFGPKKATRIAKERLSYQIKPKK